MTKSQNKKTHKLQQGNAWLALNMPFIMFLTLLCLIYIFNNLNAERNARQVQLLKGELKELDWRMMDVQQSTTFGSTQSQLSKRLREAGLVEDKSVPPKITITQG